MCIEQERIYDRFCELKSINAMSMPQGAPENQARMDSRSVACNRELTIWTKELMSSDMWAYCIVFLFSFISSAFSFHKILVSKLVILFEYFVISALERKIITQTLPITSTKVGDT